MPESKLPPDELSLPFWNGGRPFKPRVLLEDVQAYEDAEIAALKAKTPRASDIVKAKLAFIAKVLGRSTTEAVQISPTVREAQGAFDAIWGHAFRVSPGASDEPDPLGPGTS